MLHRSAGPATVVAIAAVLLASVNAGARSGGAGGGHGGAFAFGHSHGTVFGSHRMFPSSGVGHFGRHFASDHDHHFHHSHQFPFALALPDGGLLYGSYDDMYGVGGLYEPDGAGTPSLAPDIPHFALDRPPCRWQSETRAVPSHDGGTRDVTVTRCVRPAVQFLGRPADWDSGRKQYAADGNRIDHEDDGITPTRMFVAKLREPDAVDARCRSETRTVPAEGGGERRIFVTRC